MAFASRCLRLSDYTVGWISALPLELAAAIKMLDETHYPPAQGLTNMEYTFGAIGSIHLVMACLPTGHYGTNSAAAVAADLRSKFPNLRFCLLVGVGGGVPSPEHDIRLGDVVVSQPNGTSGGVVQYDLGKNTQSGFKRTETLNTPPDMLLRILSKYQANNMDLTKGNFLSHQFKPHFTNDTAQEPPKIDRLFRTDYEHTGGSSCDECDQECLVMRVSRGPVVHYGTIASGNQVVKTATVRDQLSQELDGVLCFEMEAAGIMNTLPCLVIRGICDYADSHKNKDWQVYAAIMAAAYAKELLLVHSRPRTAEPKISQALIKSPRFSSWRTQQPSGALDPWETRAYDLVRENYFMKYNISNYDPVRTYSQYIRRRCPDTGRWILNHSKYLAWKNNDSACLWLTGKIGSGKSLITSTVIESLLKDTEYKQQTILHYFFNHSFRQNLNATGLLDSLVQQILRVLEDQNINYPPKVHSNIQRYYGSQTLNPVFEETLDDILRPLASQLSKIVLVIDGLDECADIEIHKVLKLISSLRQDSEAKTFISGRESLDITKSIPGSLTLYISQSDSTEDISTYISWKLQEKMQQRCITENKELLRDIEIALLERADKMILWVALQIENIWTDCFNDSEIRETLENLPRDLDDTYSRCVRKIDSGSGLYARKYATKLLSWIITAQKPLKMIELREALAIDEHDGTLHRDRMPSAQDTLRSCANLVTLEDGYDSQDLNTAHVLLVHHSLRQFLEEADQNCAFIQELHPRLDRQDMGLARLCICHLLSSHYTLSVQTTTPTARLQLNAPAVERITAPIPRFARPFLPRSKPTAIVLPSQPIKTSIVGLPAIFHYARSQWLSLTRDISQDNHLYSQFVELALQLNSTYCFHPWQPLGNSANSCKIGPLAWSIVNSHYAIFDLVFMKGSPTMGQEILATTISEYGGFTAVILAVRYNARWALEKMDRYMGSKVIRQLLLDEDTDGWNSLYHAANCGSNDVIDFLTVDLGISYKCSSNQKCIKTPLTIAISRKDTRMVQSILFSSSFLIGAHTSDKDLSACLSIRNTELYDGHMELPKRFDSQLIKVKSHDTILMESKNAFFHAIESGKEQIIQHLMSYDLYDEQWLVKALKRIAIIGNPSMIKLLMEFPQTDNALKQIIDNNDEVVFRNLCRHGLKLTRSDPEGRNFLYRAVSTGSIAIFELCLAACDDWDICDQWSWTPLMLAASEGRIEHVRLLLAPVGDDKKVDVNARNMIGTSILDICCSNLLNTKMASVNWPIRGVDASLECVKLLVQHGAVPTDCYAAYPILRYLMNEDMLKEKDLPAAYLEAGKLDYRFEKNFVANKSYNMSIGQLEESRPHKESRSWDPTNLHEAIRYNYDAVVPQFLATNIDVNALDAKGEAPLHVAVATIGNGLMYLLAETDKDKLIIDVQDRNGNTPLHLAVIMNRASAVHSLVERGADILLKNHEGETPYSISQRRPIGEVKLVLEKAMQDLESQLDPS